MPGAGNNRIRQNDSVFHKRETELQYALHSMLSDTSIVFRDTSGEIIQVISPGIINKLKGPDFKNISIYKNGVFTCGDAEFHKREYDWLGHSHQDNPDFSNVILHIALKKSSFVYGLPRPLLLVDAGELAEYVSTAVKSNSVSLYEISEIQNYSYSRLKRRIDFAASMSGSSDEYSSLREMLDMFISRYASMKRRPVHREPENRFSGLASSLNDVYKKLRKRIICFDEISKLLSLNNSGAGDGMINEIMVNVLLPVFLANCKNTSCLEAVSWYWSAKSKNKYGKLQREFPGFPQEFVWQQQGMLEYLRNKALLRIREDQTFYRTSAVL